MRSAIKVKDRVRFRTDGEIGEYNRIYGHDKVSPQYVHEVSADGAWVGLDERTVDNKVDLLWQVQSILLDICNELDPIEKPKPLLADAKVGDWVECVDKDGNITHEYVVCLCKDCFQTWVGGESEECGSYYDYDTLRDNYSPKVVVRKLDPSEVIIKIGCLGGTVAKWNSEIFMLNPLDNSIPRGSLIAFDMLDPATRSLVESLLKKEGEK